MAKTHSRFPKSPSIPRWLLWRWWFGYPDGVFVALRCRVLGHDWIPCFDECCGGETSHCLRCYASATTREVLTDA